MQRLWDIDWGWLFFWFAVLASLLAVVVYVVKKIRAGTAQQEPRAGDLLTNFRELHSRGELSDEEFRTIKTKLAARLQEELKRSNQKG